MTGLHIVGFPNDRFAFAAKPIAEGRPIRLEFAVVTKGKTPEVAHYRVPADPQQIEGTKRIVERVWGAIEAGVFFPSPSAGVVLRRARSAKRAGREASRAGSGVL